MRSFIFTLMLFGVMLACIIGNARFIGRLCEDMLDLLDALPARAGEGGGSVLDELDSRWEDARKWVRLSVSSNDISRVNHNLVSLRAFCEFGEDADYLAAREQIRLDLEEIRRFDRFWFGTRA